MKKKTWIIIGVVVVVLAIFIGIFVGNYNGLVDREESIAEAQSNVQTLLQMRADLIPNLVATVEGYKDYESETYLAVTNARTAVKNAGTVDELADANAQLDVAAEVWVNAVREDYPELAAGKHFTALMDSLESTENQIRYARKVYNEKATDYNKAIRRFPGNIFASMFGFEKVDLFSASSDAQEVPEIKF